MHTIRLHEAWQTEPFDGGVRHIRKFGLPTNLTTERVYLVIENMEARVELNGQPLGNQSAADGPRKYDATSLLKPRNELQIIVDATSDAPASNLGEVRLEIDHGSSS